MGRAIIKIKDRVERTHNDDEGYECPYCGNVITCDDASYYDMDGEEMECEECGKKYYASALHSVTWETVPDCELNNEEHEWKEERTYFYCLKCDQVMSRNQLRAKEQIDD